MSDVFSLDIDQDYRISINAPSAASLLPALERTLVSGRGFTLATVNLDHLVKLRLSSAFREAYAAQTFVVADGNPIVWLSRLGQNPVDLVPGCELVEPLCALAARRGLPVALVGSTPEALDAAAERLEKAHPGLRIALRHAPAFGFDPEGPEADACIEEIRRSGARLCFLALGAPKQEIFAARAHAALGNCGFASVGAGVDFIAGTQRRAPVWMRRASLEWVWRLATSPRRLGRRYAMCAMILPAMALNALRARRRPAAPTRAQNA